MKIRVAIWVIAGGMLLCGSAQAQTYSRTETISYHDDLNLWVLGQVDSVTCIAPAACKPASMPNGIVMSKTTYDASALPSQTYAFGKLQSTFGYYNDGTLKNVQDGRLNVTTLSSWYRGVPRQITFPITAESPSGAVRSAVVDDNGWIKSVTDENVYLTTYDYDLMGRLSSVVYPAADSTAWNDTTITFAPVTTIEYGITAGHWKQTISTGNATVGYARKETYFDALWRPLVTREYDSAKVTATQRFTRRSYDSLGNLAFVSYPGTVDTLSTGTWMLYDALDRVTSVSQDSDQGLLTTSTLYLPGFKTQVTNPRQKVTTTSYMAYDEPTMDWPVAITHPAGAYTDIARDVFGKPLSITRHNAARTLSATRSYSYDTNQQLCAQVEPETGTTVMDYDAAGNVLWSAAGLAATLGCNRTDASIAARKVIRTYDTRNRVATLRFPDGRGDQDWNYTPDGLPNQITNYNAPGQTVPVITAYHYNKRRMLDGQGEDVTQPGWYSWGIGYGYDGNGNLSVQTYPDTVSISFAPNALGQPTQAGGYATGVTYYPNGAIHQFTYGNGIVHTMTQDSRQLPTRSTDGTAFDFGYAFDANGNVSSITDYAQAGHQSRTMTYDDLDRLLTTSSPMFNGTVATYGYNELDDLTSVKAPATTSQPARNQTYWYDPNTRQLTNIQNADTGASVHGLGYGVQGNLSNKDGRSYDFDFGNRLYMVHDGPTVVEAYRYDGLGRRVLAWNGGNILSQYARDGKLLFQANQRLTKNLDYVYLGGSLVAVREQPSTGGAATAKYQHTDALGTPVAVTSSTKSVLETNEYDPYGALLNKPIADGPGFTGHVQDAATGMTYMQQRYYDPAVGRFLSVDPVTVNGNDGSNFNRYWYANNNPYKFTDPDGREGEFVALKGLVAVAIVDAETPDPSDAAAPAKAALYASGVVGAAIGGALYYGYNKLIENAKADTQQAKEHTKGARPSTEEKHQKGQARKDRDRGGERGDSGRRPPRKAPPEHRGPWPPKPGK